MRHRANDRTLPLFDRRESPPVGAGIQAADTRWLLTGRGRLQIMSLLFALAFATIGGRLVHVMLLRQAAEPAVTSGRAAPKPSERADIVDRNGVLLATNLASASLHADARVIDDPAAAAAALVRVLPNLDPAAVEAKLASDRAFVWVKRNLTPRQLHDVNALGIPGLAFQNEQRRIYPLGSLAGHVTGFVDIDNNGIAGIEKSRDEALTEGRDRAFRLTIDSRLQHALRDELRAAMRRYRAMGAGGIILDARNGEVLALSSLPDFDPNHPGEASEFARFNRVTLGVYELGSVFKVFNTAMGLESGTVTLRDGYDASRPIRVARFTIRDDHPKRRWLSVPEIFKYSSNIGSAKLALDVGTERQRAFMDRLGMLRPSAIELPEVGAPLSPSPWREINTMTVAFGHGLAVSPMQVASATAAVINGGILHPATLIRRDGPAPEGTRVISPRTSDTMRRLLRLVVREGTGKQASIPGYLVGGKTGTADKIGPRGYDRRTILSSFVAVFPMTAPRYVVFVLLDEPHGNVATHGFATAGWTAAPTAGRVIARIAPIVGLPILDETDVEIERAMRLAPEKGRTRLASF